MASPPNETRQQGPGAEKRHTGVGARGGGGSGDGEEERSWSVRSQAARSVGVALPSILPRGQAAPGRA